VFSLSKESSEIKKHPKPPKHGGKGAKLLQHRHCQICSKAIPLSEEFCSEECRLEFDNIVKKRKSMMYLIYGSMIFMIFILVLSFI
jgi:predicted nucleic acid-binding Zn ribbon protein